MPLFYTVEPNVFNILVDNLSDTEICIISNEPSKKYNEVQRSFQNRVLNMEHAPCHHSVAQNSVSQPL